MTILSTTPISDIVRSALVSALDEAIPNWNHNNIRFAVRSSAVGEDSEELSSAGQNQTFLGCRGEASVVEAVQKCWASLYAFQSVEYRR